MTDELLKLSIPKLKVYKPPLTETERRTVAALALREYFKTFTSRPKTKKHVGKKYTLFLEPFPVLSVYRDGDETLGFKHRIYQSFRIARKYWCKELKRYIADARKVTLGQLK